MAMLKGVPRYRIVLVHALRNAIGPIAKVIALNLDYLVSGVVIVETIFAYPGLARLLPLLTDFAIRLSFIILFMSGLSFLGLGIQPPAADLGSMVRETMEGLRSGSLAPIIPAASIASVTVALNLLVDELSLRSGRNAAGGGG